MFFLLFFQNYLSYKKFNIIIVSKLRSGSMVENKKRFYLYDRWFECQEETEEKMIYISIPRITTSNMKLELEKKENKMTIFSYKGRKLVNRIEISNIESSNIELHYIEEKCKNRELEESDYNDLLIELYAEIENGIIKNSQIKFIPKYKKHNLGDSSILLNEKTNLSDLNIKSKKVEDFLDFVRSFIIHRKKLVDILTKDPKIEREKSQPLIREILIPQELEVYDRAYHLVKTQENQIILMSQEEEARSLEIKFDPIALSLISICFKINNYDSQKGILQIIPNDLNGVTARYCTRRETKVRVGDKKIETPKIKSVVIFDENEQKISNTVSIITNEKELKLIEHPYLKGNYTDGAGNLLTIGNSSYNTLLGIASFAPQIFKSVDKKIFVKKLEND